MDEDGNIVKCVKLIHEKKKDTCSMYGSKSQPDEKSSLGNQILDFDELTQGLDTLQKVCESEKQEEGRLERTERIR